VPNALSILRIAAALALPFVPGPFRIGLVLFAGVSDWLDGFIARRFNAMSPLGALLDGIADKLFVFSAVVTLLDAGRLTLWQGALVMARDVTVAAIALGVILCREWQAFGHMQVRLAGKLTTAFAIPWFATLLVPAAEGARLPLFVLAAGASVCAAIDYLLQLRSRLQARQRLAE
jgi:phosphatidylglycerophosphate synthase